VFQADHCFLQTDDNIYAVVLAQEAGSLELSIGCSSRLVPQDSFFARNFQWLTSALSILSTFPITAGVNKVKMPFVAGTPQATLLSSSGATLVDFSPSGMVITDTPTTYNYNYYMFASP
jgi:hypothetical protein